MFRKFMYGRYGNDHLNLFLIVLSLLVGITAIFVGGVADMILSLIQFILIALWICREFSRNIYKRRRENEIFLRYWNKLKKKFSGVSGFFARLKDRKHVYFKCPKCNARLRVPRGRGNITVTCPCCKNRFDKKS